MTPGMLDELDGSRLESGCSDPKIQRVKLLRGRDVLRILAAHSCCT